MLRSPRLLLLSLLASAAIVSAAPRANATTLVDYTLDEQIATAAAVVTATVRDVEAIDGTDGQVWTYVTFTVTRTFKGPISTARPLRIKQLGGQTERAHTEIHGAAHFAPGDSVLLFLGADPRPPYESFFVLAMHLGVYELELRTSDSSLKPELWAARLRVSAPVPTVAEERLRPACFLLSDLAERIDRAPKDFDPEAAMTPQLAPGLRRSGASPAYTLHPPTAPARWFEPDTAGTVAFYVNPAGFAPGGSNPPSLEAAVTHAAAEWSRVSASPLEVVYGGNTDACGFNPLNEITSVAVDCANEIPGSLCRSGIIALGGPRTYVYPFEYLTVNGTRFRRIESADIVIQDGYCPDFQTQSKLNAVITHEMGHCLGLGHTQTASDPGPALRPTMWPYVFAGMETIEQDDRDGILFIYPSGATLPTITSLAPVRAEQSQTVVVDIRGTNLVGADQTATVSISGGGTSVTVLTAAATRITARVVVSSSAIAGSRTLRVTTSGGQSNAAAFSVDEAPLAPSNASVAPSGTALRVTWADNSAVETGFKLQRKRGQPGSTYEWTTIATIATANVTSYTDTSVQSGRVYSYRVRAYREGGTTSSASNAATATAP